MDKIQLEQWWREQKLPTVWTLNEVMKDEEGNVRGFECRGVFESEIAATYAQNYIKGSQNKEFWIHEDPILSLSTVHKFGEIG
jgi:hypothetical protein